MTKFYQRSASILILVGLTFLFYFNFEEGKTADSKILKTETQKKISETKSTRKSLGVEDKKITILLTTRWWHHKHFPDLQAANEFCPRCTITENMSLWNQSSAVVFHAENINSKKIPQRTNPDQIWAVLIFESPKKTKGFDQVSDSIFNWTMTYRRNSDVFVPYGRFHLISETPRPDISSQWAFTIPKPEPDKNNTNFVDDYVVTPSLKKFKNRKLGVWIASNCKTSSLREKVIQGLRAHLEIDVYGKCGNLTCKIPNKQSSGVDCRLDIQNRYKFYFAFENSLCEDYVTEKFFETAAFTEMIPVVYGGADYNAIFPPKSFINVRDFESVESLAKHLKHVGSNSTAWLEYFNYRKSYWVQNSRFVTAYCDLCNKLDERLKVESSRHYKDGSGHKTYPSVGKWWSSASSNLDGENACTDSKNVPIIAKLLNDT